MQLKLTVLLLFNAYVSHQAPAFVNTDRPNHASAWQFSTRSRLRIAAGALRSLAWLAELIAPSCWLSVLPFCETALFAFGIMCRQTSVCTLRFRCFEESLGHGIAAFRDRESVAFVLQRALAACLLCYCSHMMLFTGLV